MHGYFFFAVSYKNIAHVRLASGWAEKKQRTHKCTSTQHTIGHWAHGGNSLNIFKSLFEFISVGFEWSRCDRDQQLHGQRLDCWHFTHGHIHTNHSILSKSHCFSIIDNHHSDDFRLISLDAHLFSLLSRELSPLSREKYKIVSFVLFQFVVRRIRVRNNSYLSIRSTI